MSKGYSHLGVTEERHKALCKEIHDIYCKKNHDYSDSFHKTFKEEGFAMVRVRIGDKTNRIKALTRGWEQKVNNESLRDTLLDLANYAIMTVMELDFMDDNKGAEHDEVPRCCPKCGIKFYGIEFSE